MIKVESLSYSYPQKDLYSNISFTVKEGQHCAFIGSSGSGKSTLTDLIIDPEEYMFEGNLEVNTNRRIGHVTQFSKLDKTRKTTVFEFIVEEFLKLENEIAVICSEMETSSDIEALLEKYQQALDAFDAIGGDDYETSINNKLNLANLMSRKDMDVSELSGGEFKLVHVIREMLNSPDLIIMDEPDVFLDFENLNSLRKLINSYKGTLLIITHNRYLLDHCFNKIVHLENMQVQEFDGRYADYNFALLQTKIEQMELAAADDEEISRNEVLIDKMRKISTDNSDPSRGRALKARVKIQERLLQSRTDAPFVEIRQPDISLGEGAEIEEFTALKVDNYSVSFDETLLENVSFEIKSTDKVALIGSNGTGKTTLLKNIMKNDSNCIELHPDIELAYLSQNQGEMLDEASTIAEEFFELGFATLQEIGSYISKYGFDREYTSQKIGALSGGEKNILQLAKVSYGKANMLLLDEPTSHLDIYSKIALEKALREYKGAVLMISHDYHSIVNCMDYVLIIEDRNIRRMNMKKFRKMIYSNHFEKDYLEIEQKRKSVEIEIAFALKNDDFELARTVSEELESLIV